MQVQRPEAPAPKGQPAGRGRLLLLQGGPCGDQPGRALSRALSHTPLCWFCQQGPWGSSWVARVPACLLGCPASGRPLPPPSPLAAAWSGGSPRPPVACLACWRSTSSLLWPPRQPRAVLDSRDKTIGKAKCGDRDERGGGSVVLGPAGHSGRAVHGRRRRHTCAACTACCRARAAVRKGALGIRAPKGMRTREAEGRSAGHSQHAAAGGRPPRPFAGRLTAALMLQEHWYCKMSKVVW